jgi:hypothetical protein
MATPEGTAATNETEGDLQFEHAEFSAPNQLNQEHVTRCAACAADITDVYFEAAGKLLCTGCRDRIEAGFQQGSRLGRVAKAFVFGSIAAAVGAIIYYAIMRLTGLNIGLVAIVVGVLVGGAVKAASGNRGGRFYQLLAVFLTYSAIAAMYVPDIVDVFRKGFEKAGGQGAPAELTDKPVAPPVGAPGKEGKPEAAKQDQPPAAGGQDQPLPAQQKHLTFASVMIALVVVLGVLVVFIYASPILVAVNSPISGLIFGFALWEAWKINRRVVLAFNGPFRLKGQPIEEPGAGIEETDD